MTTVLDVQGRRTILYVTNKSGGAVALGDVVIGDSSNDEAFTTTTTAGYISSWVGVVIEANGIANNATGRVCVQGYVSTITCNASVTRGNFIKTHTVAKQGTSAGSSRVAGVFAEALTTSATPSAVLFGMPDGSTGSAGSAGTPALTLSTTNSTGSAVTLIATDATIAAFDATVPSTQALSDAAATGSAGTAARRDHKHAMPSIDNVLPWRIDVFGILGGNPMTNWAIATAGNQYGGKVMQSSGAQNDEISFDLIIAAGTWTFTLFYYKTTICGIYTVSIDGSSIGTIDSYAASETVNVISSITGVSVASSAKHTVKLKMATKNASATNYYGLWTAFALIRTA